jgi:hypothetical protein
MRVGVQHHVPVVLLTGKNRCPLYRRLGGLQGRSGWVRKISSPPPTRIRSPERPGRSESLYRLRYSGPPETLINIYKPTLRHIPECCENFILCISTNSLARHPKCHSFTLNCTEHEFWIYVVWNACAVTNRSVLCFLARRIFLHTPAICVHFTQNPVFRKFRSSSLSEVSVLLALDKGIAHKMAINFPSTFLFRRRLLTV